MPGSRTRASWPRAAASTAARARRASWPGRGAGGAGAVVADRRAEREDDGDPDCRPRPGTSSRTRTTTRFTGRPVGHLERQHHRLEGERDRDVELEHLLARLEDPADPAQVELGGRGAHDLVDVAPDLLVDELPGRARGDGDRVAVDRDEVHQAAVDDVEVATLGAGLLVALELGQGGGVLAGAAAALDHAVRRVEVGLLAGVELAGDQVGLLLGDLVEVGGGVHAGAERGQPGRDARPPRGGGCGWPRRGPGRGPGRCGPGWRGRRTTRAPSSTPSVRTRNAATSSVVGVDRVTSRQRRADGRQDVLDRRRAEHPDGAVGGLLDRLEQGVAGLLGQPVGVLDDQDLPAPADRGERGAPDQVADLVDADRQLLGPDDRHVGVRAGQHGVAGVALRRSRSVSHCSAAANAMAALERPEPGGPVNSQAWLMPWPPAAVWSAGITWRWPTRPSQTVPVVGEERGSRTAVIASPARAGAQALADRGGDLVDRRRGRRARGSGRGRPRRSRGTPARTRWWNSTDSPSIRSRSSNRPRPCSGSRSSTTVRCGRRSPVAQRATRSTSATTRSRPAPW